MNMGLRMNRMVAVDLNPQEGTNGCSEFQVEAGVGGGAYLGYQASSVLSDNTNGL
jgi:hypothetical protein